MPSDVSHFVSMLGGLTMNAGQVRGRSGVVRAVRTAPVHRPYRALSQSLAMLLIGWSLLEGIGAALIMPAVVALVASNFGRADRPRAYGLVASAGAIAVAAGR